jgi:hypothetical protein
MLLTPGPEPCLALEVAAVVLNENKTPKGNGSGGYHGSLHRRSRKNINELVH